MIFHYKTPDFFIKEMDNAIAILSEDSFNVFEGKLILNEDTAHEIRRGGHETIFLDRQTFEMKSVQAWDAAFEEYVSHLPFWCWLLRVGI